MEVFVLPIGYGRPHSTPKLPRRPKRFLREPIYTSGRSLKFSTPTPVHLLIHQSNRWIYSTLEVTILRDALCQPIMLHRHRQIASPQEEVAFLHSMLTGEPSETEDSSRKSYKYPTVGLLKEFCWVCTSSFHVPLKSMFSQSLGALLSSLVWDSLLLT